MRQASPSQNELLESAALALARAGLVHAYGHCSLRLDANHFLVCAAGPMGLVSGKSHVICSIDGELPEGVLGEVRAHQKIYQRRDDIKGVCRVMPPATMALSSARIVPRPRHGIGALLGGEPVLWDDPTLLRSDDLAADLADKLGSHCCIVMRGNGAITVAESLEKAVVIAWFLEDAARVEERILSMGLSEQSLLSASEREQRNSWQGSVVSRMWEYLTTPNRIGTYDGGR